MKMLEYRSSCMGVNSQSLTNFIHIIPSRDNSACLSIRSPLWHDLKKGKWELEKSNTLDSIA